MKRIYLILLFSLFHLMASAQSLQVAIKQDGKPIQAVNGIYQLKKAPFVFEIKASNLEGFLIGATTDEQVYRSAVGPFNPEVSWFQNTGLAEEEYNISKELYLMDLAPSYWYYTDAKDHRFDKNPVGDLDNWAAKRSINSFFDVMINQSIDIKDFDGNVYLLMYAPEYDEYYDLIDKQNLFNATLQFTE